MSVMQDYASLKVPTTILNELWEQLLIKNGECWGRVISNSMHPLINIGDQVLVEKTAINDIRLADIIVFKRNGKFTIHRVLGKHDFGEERYFLEKGDATHLASLIPEKSVIGRVSVIKKTQRTIHTISGGGRFLQLLFTYISYTSMKFWLIIEFCLTRGRRTTCQSRYPELYNKFFSLFNRLILLHL